MKKTLLSLTLLALTSSACAQTWNTKEVNFKLNACTRKDDKTVICQFTVTGNGNKDINHYFSGTDFRIISPSGQEVNYASINMNGQNINGQNYFNLRQGISYTYDVIFEGFNGNQIRYFDLKGGERKENVTIQTGKPLILPGFASQRQTLKLESGETTAFLTGCYAQAKDSQSANCYVNIIFKNSTVNQDAGINYYPSTLMEITARIKDGSVPAVAVAGGVVFTNVPLTIIEK